jgi:hypothetical protein
MRLATSFAAILAAPLLCVSSPAPAKEDPRVAAALARLPSWRSSVVMLRITCESGDTYEAVGVLVRKTGEVLSAAHVGSRCLGVDKAAVGIVRSPYATPGNDLTATLKARIADNVTSLNQKAVEDAAFQDLALWKIDNMERSGLVPARIAKSFPVAGDPIEIVGFANLPFTHSINGEAGKNSGAGITRYRTWISSVAGTKGTNVPYRVHYPGFTLQGLSGGPVFNASGELIGIHSARRSRPIEQALFTGCVTAKPNCVAVPSDGSGTSTLGLDIDALKTMLENYSWATSVHAVPTDWLPKK